MIQSARSAEFVKHLCALTEKDFEAEVCDHVARAVLGFFRLARANGDGGLDGVSDNGATGYCCYGPAANEERSPARRATAIVNKFKKDLCRILELDAPGTKNFRENTILAANLPSNTRLKHIHLLTSWADDLSLYRRLVEPFEEYKSKSRRKFVEADATITVKGASAIATMWGVTDAVIAGLENRLLAERLRQLESDPALPGVDPTAAAKFEHKMDLLKQILPNDVEEINRLAGLLRSGWTRALRLEQHLSEISSVRHRALEDARAELLLRVTTQLLGVEETWTRLPGLRETASTLVLQAIGSDFDGVAGQAGSGEIARLIGECPIRWRPRHA